MNKKLMAKFVLLTAIAVVAAACTDDKQDKGVESGPAQQEQAQLKDSRFSVESITRGAAVFQSYCAECHGPDAQGHPDWGNPKAQYVVAPPLDGTGPSWKRSRKDLANIIVTGVVRDGKSVMPGWKGRLKPEEVHDTIIWFQALWPSKVYDRWEKAQAGSQKGSS
ncbi:MAG: cytochrome c [Proteobacteria bacterium]|nr:cytochrome c [Pseudomonadota bacterium]